MTRRLSSPVFVGRRSELALLEAAVQRASDGRPVVIVLAGEAGVGKSRLVAELAARAGDSGARVLVGHGVELGEVGVPFAPVVEALRRLAADAAPGELDRLLGPERRELRRLVPAFAAGATPPASGHDDAASIQAALFEHLLAALGRLARDRPLVLVLEDLHWADGSTRDLVRYLARNIRSVRVVLLLTYRSDDLHRRHPLRPVLADLERLGAERIRLTPFDRDEVAAQVSAILGRTTDRTTAERIQGRSDGNAFFVEELLAAGAEGDAPLPETVGEVIASRVARLGVTTQATLRIAAVIGRQASHQLLARVGEADEQALLDAIREAVDEQLLIVHEDQGRATYAFRHALTQEVLAEELLPTQRVALHRRVAELLEADAIPGTESEIAHHWHMAHALPEAFAASIRAAAAASALTAYADAHARYELAIELWPSVPDAAERSGLDHPGLLLRAADAASSGGALLRATALSDQAAAELAGLDPARELEAIHRSVQVRWLLGEGEAAEGQARRGIAGAGREAAPGVRSQLLSDLAYLQWDARCYLDALRTATHAVRLADESDDSVHRARAHVGLGMALGEVGRPGAAIDVLRVAIALLDGGPADLRVHAGVALTHVLNIAGLAIDSTDATAHELRVAQNLGLMGSYGPALLANYLDGLIDTGDYDGAERVLAEHGDPRDRSRASAWLHQSAAEVAVARDDLAAATSQVALARMAAGDAGPTDALWLEYCEAGLAQAEGRNLEARIILDRTIERSRSPRHDMVVRYPLERSLDNEAHLAAIAAARGDATAAADARERGVRVAGMLENLFDGVQPAGWEPSIRLFRLRTAAQLARLQGRPNPDAWAAVAEAAGVLGRRAEMGAARLREAEAALASDRQRATAAVADALAIAAELGAHALAREAEAFRRRARLAAPRPAGDGRGSLSGREREVLALVAAGRTNRQIGDDLFISEKTASVHVTHILEKLGVGSRTEAALVGVRLGLVDRGGSAE